MTSIAIHPEQVDGYQLVALDRGELEAAHGKMIDWAKGKLDRVDVDVDVERTSLDIAVKNGWLVAPFERRLNILARQRTFYEKIVEALRAGYAIVPNFAMNVFAIRTNAARPRGKEEQSTWARFIQPAQLLPAGEGRYVDPAPQVYSEERVVKDGSGKDVTRTFQSPSEEFDEVAFPIALAKPQLMTRVGEAMAHKLFDEIGVAVDSTSRGRGDPILLGRLLNPRRNRQSLTFFLGWYFDPSAL
jgi:hypothetical protein